MENKFDFLIGEMVMWKGVGEQYLEGGYEEEDVENDFGLITEVLPRDCYEHITLTATITWCDNTTGHQTFRLDEKGKVVFLHKNLIYPVSEDDL